MIKFLKTETDCYGSVKDGLSTLQILPFESVTKIEMSLFEHNTFSCNLEIYFTDGTTFKIIDGFELGVTTRKSKALVAFLTDNGFTQDQAKKIYKEGIKALTLFRE